MLIEGRIERETLIEAPIERVWALVNEPGWWAVHDPSEVAGTVAREGETVVAPNSHYGDFPVRVERVEPPTYVAYRWASAFPGNELRDDNSTLIEFTLVDVAGKTRLRVVESGFDSVDWSDESKARYADNHSRGWQELLGRLRLYAPSVP